MKINALRGALCLVLALLIAVPVLALATGDVETVLELPDGNLPEGITFDRDGNMYFGNRFPAAGGGFSSELRKITPDGKHDTVIATFAPSTANGLLGLAADGDGDVWAAVDGGDDHGVWRVSGNGKKKERIDGSQAMDFPNALTFDAKGNLYVTDSGPVTTPVGGAIWRLAKNGKTLEIWSEDEALAPLEANPLGGTPPGANGIAFFPPDSLYVANTEKGQIFRIPIQADGSAGAAEAVTAFFGVPTIDGIAVDVQGNVYGVLPAHAILPLLGLPPVPPVVRVDPKTGIPERATLSGFDGSFDIPLSLAFDTLPGEGTNVYITNGDLQLVPFPIGPGPRILRANVGVKGFPGN
jgi:sugar lactone lactonase YvrE